MKILILANNDIGLYKFRKELIQSLLSRGIEIYISLPYGAWVEPLKQMGCKFINTPIDRRAINPFKDLKLLLHYYRMLYRLKPDLCITYTIKPNVYGGLAARMNYINYVVNITGLGTAFQQNGPLRKIVTMLYKFACKKAATVFFENNGNREMLLKLGVVKKEQACLINGAGVNLTEYAFTDFPEDNGKTKFLFIGRVMREKGVDELLDAAVNLKQHNLSACVTIVGPCEEEYLTKLHRLEQDGVIRYFGYQQDVKPFIRDCHCFVLPSYHEGMANTLLEAGAMGRPLITSRIHGCMEALEDNVSGYLCNAKNAAELFNQMKRFCKLSYADKVKMGSNSHVFIAQNFDKCKVVRKTLEALHIG